MLVSDEEPVPPLLTGSVPVTSEPAVDRVTEVPSVVDSAPAELVRPVPVRSLKPSPLIVNVSPVCRVRLPLAVIRPLNVLLPAIVCADVDSSPGNEASAVWRISSSH